MRYFERQRIDFIQLRLQVVGFINRSDLINQFQISPAQAANDFTKYKGLAKKWKMPNMIYNLSKKRYEVKYAKA